MVGWRGGCTARRSGCTVWLSSTVAIPIATMIPIVAVVPVTGLKAWDISFQAWFQRGRAAVLESFRQVASRIIACQLTTGVRCIVGCQELRVGQQHIDLAVAKDPLGGNRAPRGCCACESPLV